MATLRSAIQLACTANGWTLTGDILHKGSVAMRVTAWTRTGAGGAELLEFKGGTGVSGAALTNPAPGSAEIGGIPALALLFPVTYHVFVHAAPDEVYVVAQYNVDRAQYAAWGQSTLPLPGSGAWFSASSHGARPAAYGDAEQAGVLYNGFGGHSVCAAFWRSTVGSTLATIAESFIHHGLDGATWSDAKTLPQPSAYMSSQPLLSMLPSVWNGESVLLPIQAVMARPSNRYSLVVDCAHARYARLDNHNPFEVFAIGSDQWMMIPWLRKNSAVRNGGATGTAADVHSGTLGFAVRYDGP
ncbi:MAG: hypothetical protein LCI02_04830 [Proteobacteria bacterium]|nr:hypothetical protein [Pseudomonadota bacterium]